MSMLPKSCLLAALACFSQAASATTVMSKIHSAGGYFKDEDNRIVMLRGINVAGNSKVPPFTPLADVTVLEPLQDLGFNSLRLLFNWEAFEPEEGAYNEAYLNYYENVVKWAAEHDFYVIADFHQDAFSRYSVHGCGEGFPRWALPPQVTPSTPDNGARCKNWALWMIVDPSMHMSWHHFYANTYGVRERYLAMLEKVAQRLSSYPNVVGYDLINEPWGDEVREVAPFYADATARVRRYHPTAMMFLNPHVLIGSGMAQTKLPKPTFDNFAYAPHYYDASVVGPKYWMGIQADGVVDKMLAKAEEWDAPLFLGEFGSPAKAGRAGEYVDHLYDILERRFLSGAQWVYTPQWNPVTLDGWNIEDLSILDDKQRLRANYTPRPSWHKIAGLPHAVRHTRSPAAGRQMSLTWQHDPEAGSTEVYLPPANLREDGKEVVYTVSPSEVTCRHDVVEHKLTCSTPTPQLVTIDIDY